MRGALPADLARWATALRQAHFPPERNFLAAHVTLFHALPPSAEPELRALLAAIAADEPPPEARLSAVIKLGRGTALAIESPAMLQIRDRIAERMHGLLTPQDTQRPRLHITIQNKVTADAARELHAALAPTFTPADFAFRGLSLHEYRGGPWRDLRLFAFRGHPVRR